MSSHSRIDIFTPVARYRCPMRPRGLVSPSTFVTLVSAMSVRTSGGVAPKVRTNRRDGNGRDTREGALPLLPSGPGGVHVPASSRPQAVDIFSGEGGIRTHDTLSDIHAFQACAFSRSATSPASGERRIRTYGTVAGTPDFESGAFDHSASSPAIQFSTFRATTSL